MVSLARQSTTQGTDLLRQYLASGSPDAFAAIMRAYGGMVYGVCLRVTKDPHDAEDASQAVFLTLAVQCRTGAKINYLGPWLQKVGKRVALDLVRSRKRRHRRETVSALNGPQDEPGSQHVETDNGEVHQMIRAELDALPSRYRLPLVMHYFGGLSHEDLARELACTSNTLGVRLHRGRKMLGERLSARGISLDSLTLGLLLAAVVRQAVSDHCFSTTAAAASQLASGTPLSACFHAGDPAVVHLIQQVALAAPRARLKFAAVTMAIAATALAGTGELWRRSTTPAVQPIENLIPRLPLRIPVERYLPEPRAEMTGVAPSVGSSALTPVSVRVPRPEADSPPENTPPTVASASTPPPFKLAAAVTSPPAAGGPNAWQDVPIQRTAAGATLPFWQTAAVQDHSGSETTRSAPVGPRPLPLPEALAPARPSAPIGALPPPTARALRRGAEALPPAPPVVVPQTSVALPPPSQFSTNDARPFSTGALELGTSAPSRPAPTAAAVAVHKGYGVYSWTKPADTTRRPSSVRPGADIDFALYDSHSDGYVSIDSVSRIDSTIPAVPEGHTFINFWKLESSVEFSQITLSVRYDNDLATFLGLPEDQLKLWVYDGGWRRINDDTFVRDLVNHRLSGTVADASLIAVSAPEPSAVVGVTVLLGGWLLRRKRRNG